MTKRRATLEIEDPLLTPVEVSERLQVGESTLRQWRWKGKGPNWIKVGRHVRYPLKDFEDWIAAGADSPERIIETTRITEVRTTRKSVPKKKTAS